MKYFFVGVLIIFVYILTRFISYNIFEGFESDLPTIGASGENFCFTNSSNPQDLNNKCGSLTEKNCNLTSCCVWLNGSSCVAGNANGPTFKSKDGKNIDVEYYSYKNKQFK
jgi:hypothetical protein